MRKPKPKFKPGAKSPFTPKSQETYTPTAPTLNEITDNTSTLTTPLASAPVTRDSHLDDLAINTEALAKMSHFHDAGKRALASATPDTPIEHVAEATFLTDGFEAGINRLTKERNKIETILGHAPTPGRGDAVSNPSRAAYLEKEFKEGLDTLPRARDSIRH